jgi:hypothetical protein
VLRIEASSVLLLLGMLPEVLHTSCPRFQKLWSLNAFVLPELLLQPVGLRAPLRNFEVSSGNGGLRASTVVINQLQELPIDTIM